MTARRVGVALQHEGLVHWAGEWPSRSTRDGFVRRMRARAAPGYPRVAIECTREDGVEADLHYGDTRIVSCRESDVTCLGCVLWLTGGDSVTW